ncbi:cytochrome b-c1 complex subunit 2, mitochondrial [Diachasma alloeum]|uniref:Core protein 2, ubiquinol-cytochrome c reductase n=1 Tax=Diachasma alloeum TaxID=454923 RepID=A0A4E0RMN0_9HYME|nr:cytochrome b-c1 complex subunit 2, mitochondrial [Diachasma alloeum]THK33028.1 core protein 2, ubiquinol-cytochrome c reductase [Diachasma alloeum]
MACSAVRCPILRNSTVRSYAALAKAAQSSPAATVDTQVLGNKVTVAALDNNSPIAQVSIIFKAGSRNETYDTQGITHLLRIAAGLTTSRSSTFAITRNIQQLGGNLYAVSDRESIAYTLQITRDKLENALVFLEDAATRQVFKPWEVSDSTPRLRYELSTLPENVRIVELLHKVAYREGLGYSLYSPKRHLDKIPSETLQHYVNTWYTGGRCAVVATGLPLSEISPLASGLTLGSGSGNTVPSKFAGGEIRKERNSPLASVALAVEGSGFDKEADALAFAVLQKAVGTGPHVKWGTSTAPLQRAVASAAGSEPFAITAFNASYSDSGLFGFLLQAPASAAGPLTKAAYKWMSSPNITDADIARGKSELKASILHASDNSISQLENLAQQTLFKGRIISPAGLAAEVDKVSPADVKKAAGKLTGKVALAAIGNLSTVPHVDQLS